MTTRRDRGLETDLFVAEWFREHGWDRAKAAGRGHAGRDVTGMPGIYIDNKSRREINMTVFLRDTADKAGDDLPVVICRPDGFGRLSMPDWPVIFRLSDATTLLLDSGYGREAPPRA